MTDAAVLDASALAGLLLDASESPEVDSVVSTEATRLVIPYLCDVEVASFLRSALLRGEISGARAAQALEHYRALPLLRFEHLPLLSRVLQLKDNFSAYDAAYVALAEAVSGRLYTKDARLARAVTSWTDVQVVEV